jgi:hypothetical protein
MEQFAHDSAQRLQWLFAFFDEMLEEGFDVGVMTFGAKGRHVERLADLAVSRFGEPRGLMHARAGVKGSGIEAGVFDPLFVRESFRQEQQLAHEGDGTRFGDLFWSGELFGRVKHYL